MPEDFLAASAFGQHRKFPPHARKTSGTLACSRLSDSGEDAKVKGTGNTNAGRYTVTSVSREGYTPVFGHDVMESNPSSAIVIYTSKRAKKG